MKFKSIRSVGTEVVSIVIGVLLALGVNEWNEDRTHRARAEEALLNIKNEIESNTKLIQFVNKSNAAIVQSMQDPPEEDEKENLQQFIPALQIQDTAWRTMLSTGVSEHVEYATLFSISEVYSLQEIYKSLGYQLVQSAMNSSESDSETGMPRLNRYLGSMVLIVQIETALLDNYSKTLGKLGSV